MLKAALALFSVFFILSGCYGTENNKEAKNAGETAAINLYTWDFGKVKEGEIVEHNFVIKNTAGKAINIKSVHTSCGCTASAIEKNSLLPGESTFLQVKFNSKGYSGPTQQFIYVNTDNLDNPILRFIIIAEVAKE